MGWIQVKAHPLPRHLDVSQPQVFLQSSFILVLWVLPVPLLSLTDQKLFYYSGNIKITSIRYNNELSRQSSGRFRDLSERVERLVSLDHCAFPLLGLCDNTRVINVNSTLLDHRCLVYPEPPRLADLGNGLHESHDHTWKTRHLPVCLF